MGSRGTLKSADRATTHGCLDWRSEVIFKLKGLTLISHFVDDLGEILHSTYFIMTSQSGTGSGALPLGFASTSTDSEGQAHDKNTRLDYPLL